MKKLIKSLSYAICMLLTCVFVGCIPNQKSETQVKIDSLQVEFDNAYNLVLLHDSLFNEKTNKNDYNGAGIHNDSTWYYTRKMISVNSEILHLQNAR